MTSNAPAGDVTPSGDATPPGDVTPSGHVPPNGEAEPAGKASSAGDATHAGKASSRGHATPAGDATPAMKASSSGHATPAGDATQPTRKPPRMAYDIVRLGLAAVAGTFVGAVTVVIMAVVGAGQLPWSAIVVGLFVFSAISSAFYIVHTLWVFARVDSATLRAWLDETTPRGRFAQFGAELSGTGPTIAVQWSVVAIASVILFTVWPDLLDQEITVWLSILVVATSWAVTVIAYAVHYARMDFNSGGFQYPDDKGRVFMDFVYLAVQVQTTFSTSDVSLTRTAARSLVTGHTIVSFAFNTVIIAMLITVLFLDRGGAH